MLGTFIGGRYSCTWNAADVGITEDGYTLTLVTESEDIRQSDVGGRTLLDFFYLGTNTSIVFNGLEYKSASVAVLQPWATLGAIGTIARLAVGSSIAAQMVLTSTAGTPAASAPTSLTATRTILAPQHQGALRFSSTLRKVPIRLELLPSDSMVAFTTA